MQASAARRLGSGLRHFILSHSSTLRSVSGGEGVKGLAMNRPFHTNAYPEFDGCDHDHTVQISHTWIFIWLLNRFSHNEPTRLAPHLTLLAPVAIDVAHRKCPAIRRRDKMRLGNRVLGSRSSSKPTHDRERLQPRLAAQL